MTRRVLFCTIGMAPSVVTETAWALQTGDKWTPHEIVIVTTSRGLKALSTALDPRLKRFEGIYEKAPPIRVIVPDAEAKEGRFECFLGGVDGAGPPSPPNTLLEDIEDASDAILMGNVLYRELMACSQAGDEVHLSLAGGRKTMSAHALIAFCVAARPGWRASHVLVDPRFENNRTFYHPAQKDPVIEEVRHNGPEGVRVERREVDPAKIDVRLFDTPVPMLGSVIDPKQRARLFDLDEAARMLTLAAEFAREKRIVLRVRKNIVEVNGKAARLPPKHFATYRLCAMALKEGWPGAGPQGTGGNHRGWLSEKSLFEGRDANGAMLGDLFAKYLTDAARADVKNGWTDALAPAKGEALVKVWDGLMAAPARLKQKAEAARARGDAKTETQENQPDARDDPVVQVRTYFGSHTKLKQSLKKHFGELADTIGPLQAETTDRMQYPDGKLSSVLSRWGLDLPPHAIEIDEDESLS